jgi:hypothetical protein
LLFPLNLLWRLVALDVGAIAPLLEASHVLLVRFELLVDVGVRIGSNHASKRRVVHDRQVVEDFRGFRWVTSLRTMTISHSLLGIDVIVRGLFNFAKVHTAASPVGPEAAGFNASELDAPLWLYLFRDGFREAFDSPLASAVDTEGRNACNPE